MFITNAIQGFQLMSIFHFHVPCVLLFVFQQKQKDDLILNLVVLRSSVLDIASDVSTNYSVKEAQATLS